MNSVLNGFEKPKAGGHFLFFFQTGRKLKSKNELRLRTTAYLCTKSEHNLQNTEIT